MSSGQRQTRDANPELFDGISQILFRHDPIEIAFEDNFDEYESEVETILPRLVACKNSREVRDVVYGEMLQWFDAEDVGPSERYDPIAEEIFALLERIRG